MHRFKIVRLFWRMNFPDHRLRGWAKHPPCDEHECDLCNPLVSDNMALW